MQTQNEAVKTEIHGRLFIIFIDGKEFHIENPSLTGREIMALGGIPVDVGLVLVLEDGTQVQIKADEVVEIKPGIRFKKAPRFVRG